MTPTSASAFAQALLVIRAEMWSTYRRPWTRTLGILFPYSAAIAALLVLTFDWPWWTIPILTACAPAAILMVIGFPAELVSTLRTPRPQRWYIHDSEVRASARVKRRRDRSWRVVSVAAWPPYLRGGTQVMEQVVAWADSQQRRLDLIASSSTVADWYRRRYDFEGLRRRLHRIPQSPEEAPGHDDSSTASGADPRSR